MRIGVARRKDGFTSNGVNVFTAWAWTWTLTGFSEDISTQSTKHKAIKQHLSELVTLIHFDGYSPSEARLRRTNPYAPSHP
jgi:hypothetical protein